MIFIKWEKTALSFIAALVSILHVWRWYSVSTGPYASIEQASKILKDAQKIHNELIPNPTILTVRSKNTVIPRAVIT